METGNANIRTEQVAQNAPNIFPCVVEGDISPYPTVVIVMIAHQIDSGIVLNLVPVTLNKKFEIYSWRYIF